MFRPPDPPDSFEPPDPLVPPDPSEPPDPPDPCDPPDPPESPDWEPEEELDDDPVLSLSFEVRCAASEDVDSLSLAFARLSVE